MITCLHGFLGLPSDWDIFEKAWDHDLYKIDLASYAQQKLSLEQWAKQFNQEVTSQSGPRILLGYSMGGRLALHALIDQPELWDAAIIISAHPGLDSEALKAQRARKDQEWLQNILEHDWNDLISAWNQQLVFGGLANPLQRNETDFDRKILAHMLTHWSLSQQKNLLPKLKNINTPMLWISGCQDQPYSAMYRDLKSQLPQCQFTSIPHAAHRVPWENTKQFTQALNTWLTNFFY